MRAAALLFSAARADHATTVIRPALQRGAVVLSDRYLDLVRGLPGGVARSLGERQIRDLSLWATDDLVPDLTVILDIDPRVGLARAQDANRLEAEPSFHDAVRAAFLRFADAHPDRYQVVAADSDREAVAAAIAGRVDVLLGRAHDRLGPSRGSNRRPSPSSGERLPRLTDTPCIRMTMPGWSRDPQFGSLGRRGGTGRRSGLPDEGCGGATSAAR